MVNISTSQTVAAGGPTPRPSGPGGQSPEARPGPQLPPGSPFEEFFEEFFKNRRGQGENKGGGRRAGSIRSAPAS